MKKLILLIVLLNTGLLFSQTVLNVAFTQRTDGSLLVDITYDLTASEAVTITVEASRDNGATWAVACTSLTGAVGEGIEENEGENKSKSIVWDFYADNPLESGDNYVVKVTAEVPTTGTLTIGSNTYNTVKIGNQWWMAENLRETHYRDGTPIPEVTDNTTWANLSTGARCAYNNDETTADTYGYLYNWYAVNNHNVNSEQYLAPAGWRVPTDADWTALTEHLGGLSVAGDKMKTTGTSHWQSPNTGATNESGFSALPAGYRDANGVLFIGLGNDAYFWSATAAHLGSAWRRSLHYNASGVGRLTFDQRVGFSVRLVREESD